MNAEIIEKYLREVFSAAEWKYDFDGWAGLFFLGTGTLPREWLFYDARQNDFGISIDINQNFGHTRYGMLLTDLPILLIDIFEKMFGFRPATVRLDHLHTQPDVL